ncbi:MAG: response regulator [bacterium]|nr:MAG: response regulator [bacterium]
MGRKRILIVDDNEFFLRQQTTYLQRSSFDISSAVTGKEALRKARKLLPDLILLDQILPDKSGQDVCRELKKDPVTASMPIIIVSSGDRETSRARTAEAGCDGLIFKPIRRDLLVTMVEELLGVATRRWSRAAVSLPCTVRNGEEQVTSTLYSLSGGGVFVALEGSPMPGDILGLVFRLPGDGEVLSVRSAAVVWRGRYMEMGPEGVGLRFLTIDAADQERIDTYVLSLSDRP